MTRRQVAARVGVSAMTVARWVSGSTVPRPPHRAALYSAFGIPVEAWPDEWLILRDIIIKKLAAKAPALLEEIVEEIERSGTTLE